jgi:hypothetical protein
VNELAARMFLEAVRTPELGPVYTWPGHQRPKRPVTMKRDGHAWRTFDGAHAPERECQHVPAG